MKDLVDYIKYHGYITSIRDKVDKDYIWFDICQKELYKDKNGKDKNNLSFFSARMYIEYSYKIELRVGKDELVVAAASFIKRPYLTDKAREKLIPRL